MLGLIVYASILGIPTNVEGPIAPDGFPWTTYQAEDAKTTGTVVPRSLEYWSAGREASGQSYVVLKEGQSIALQSKSSANAIVIRYSLPASEDGSLYTGFLAVEVGKKRLTLNVSNKFMHQFGAYPFTKRKADGNHRNYWDEVRTIIPNIGLNETLTIYNTSKSQECLIDLVDMEFVKGPLSQPAQSVSITDFGAVPNDSIDDTEGITAALAEARTTKRPLWIPRGSFVLKGTVLLDNITILGAGMWYSTLQGVEQYTPENRVNLYGNGSNIHLKDFAINGNLTYRNDSEPNDAVGGSFGKGSSLANLWIKHSKAGMWLVNSEGLTIDGCRFRNTLADGINLCLGMKDTIVTRCSARGTGDDGFAMWPATYAASQFRHSGNSFVNCRAELPYLAQGFSIYGGENNRIVNCKAIDIPYGAGVMVSSTFPTEFGFVGITQISNCSIARSGADDGCIAIVGNQRSIRDVDFRNIRISEPFSEAVKFTCFNGNAIQGVTFTSFYVENSTVPILGFSEDAKGNATFTFLTTKNCSEPLFPETPEGFSLSIK
ncbi:MAG: right-handed parallel beta-helix repeat-containing protein [Armatimonadetes bacterium]|nr:right-handed parallel beta-helix repeat-containing protein [Armatimonadota bacterium]